MKTPENTAGQVTEKIMARITAALSSRTLEPLNTRTYNAIYECIYCWLPRQSAAAPEVPAVVSALRELDAIYARLKAAEKQATWGGSFEREDAARRQAGEIAKELWDATLKLFDKRAHEALRAIVEKPQT